MYSHQLHHHHHQLNTNNPACNDLSDSPSVQSSYTQTIYICTSWVCTNILHHGSVFDAVVFVPCSSHWDMAGSSVLVLVFVLLSYSFSDCFHYSDSDSSEKSVDRIGYPLNSFPCDRTDNCQHHYHHSSHYFAVGQIETVVETSKP